MSVDPRLARSRPQQTQPVPVPPPPPPPSEPQPVAIAPAPAVEAPRDAKQEGVVPDGQFKLKFCTVCASNQNRYVFIDNITPSAL